MRIRSVAEEASVAYTVNVYYCGQDDRLDRKIEKAARRAYDTSGFSFVDGKR